MNWPIGMGSDFKGVVNLSTKRALLFMEGDTAPHKLRPKKLTGMTALSWLKGSASK